MDSITIQGHDFNVDAPYAEGHVLKANEAKALNQTRAENLRNNFASAVKAKIKEVLGKDKVEEDEQLPADVLAALQAEFDKYAAEYEFNVRTGSTATPRDPVKAEAIKMARKAIRDAIKAGGEDPKSYDDDSLEAAAAELLDSDSAFMEAAQAIVAQRQSVAGKKIALPVKSAA